MWGKHPFADRSGNGILPRSLVPFPALLRLLDET